MSTSADGPGSNQVTNTHSVGDWITGYGPPELSREDGRCVNCKAAPATENWCPGGSLGWSHGLVYAWCKRCVLTEQIKHCQEMADALPELKAALANLPQETDHAR